jgi:hypothetical protein
MQAAANTLSVPGALANDLRTKQNPRSNGTWGAASPSASAMSSSHSTTDSTSTRRWYSFHCRTASSPAACLSQRATTKCSTICAADSDAISAGSECPPARSS